MIAAHITNAVHAAHGAELLALTLAVAIVAALVACIRARHTNRKG